MDSVRREADIGLGEGEDIVPQTSLKIVFHLGQIEVRTRAPLDKFLGIMIEKERKVEDGTGHGLIVDGDARFVQVPTTRTGNDLSISVQLL